jgi:hypothetical protein
MDSYDIRSDVFVTVKEVKGENHASGSQISFIVSDTDRLRQHVAGIWPKA